MFGMGTGMSSPPSPPPRIFITVPGNRANSKLFHQIRPFRSTACSALIDMRTTSVSGHWSATAVHLAVPAPGVHPPGVLSRALHGHCPTED